MAMTTEDPQTIREMGEAGADEHPVEFRAPEQLSLDIGGRKPDTSRIKLRAIEREIEGSYKQTGGLVPFLVWARQDETSIRDSHDTDGRITDRKKVHTFNPQSMRPLPAELVERLDL